MLSLAMIVKDEQETIDRVLLDVSDIFDEIVVVDTGSTDLTEEIAVRFGAKVHHFPWTDDFAAARNASFAFCEGDWIVWLDADDRVTADNARSIASIYESVRHREDIDAVVLPYNYEYEPNSNEVSLRLFPERLIRNQHRSLWLGVIHERMEFAAERVLVSNEAQIDHRPTAAQTDRKSGRNLRIAESAFTHGDRSPHLMRALAMELVNAGRDSEASECFSELLRHPEGVTHRYQVLCTFALCEKRLGRSQRFLELMAQAIALDSQQLDAYVESGLHFVETRKWSRAITYFGACTAIQSSGLFNDVAHVDDGSSSWNFAWDYISICTSGMGDLDETVGAVRKALDESHDIERLLNNLRLILEVADLEKSERT